MDGKLYRLKCSTGHFYIGSTTQSLRHRLSDHKQDSKQSESQVYRFIKKIGWNNVVMELMETHKYNTREQLLVRETELIRPALLDPLCLNTNLASCNPEEIKASKAAYRDTHREEAKAYQQTHKEEIKVSNAAYRETHREEARVRTAAYRETHKEETKASKAAYQQTHKEETKATTTAYRETHKEEIKASKAAYQQTHKEDIKSRKAARYKANKALALQEKQSSVDTNGRSNPLSDDEGPA